MESFIRELAEVSAEIHANGNYGHLPRRKRAEKQQECYDLLVATLFVLYERMRGAMAEPSLN